MVAVGLLAFSLWRYTEAFTDLSEISKDKSNAGNRLRYLFSATTYLLIAYTFIKPLLNKPSGGNSKQNTLAELLEKEWGYYVVLLIAAIGLIAAGFQLYLGYSAKFMKKMDKTERDKTYLAVKRAGQSGYFARGVVFIILSYFVAKVAFEHNANNYQGTKGALQYLLEQPMGSVLLGIVAAGLLGYGIFCFYVGKYTKLTTDG